MGSFHRVGRRALFGKMDNCSRLDFFKQTENPMVLSGQIDVSERDSLSSNLLPRIDALRNS